MKSWITIFAMILCSVISLSAFAAAPQGVLEVYPAIHFGPPGQSNTSLGQTLEATFTAQLDELYRKYQPPVKRLQFVDVGTQDYDLLISGNYSRRAHSEPGFVVTVTILNVKTNRSESFQAEGDGVRAAVVLAGAVFREYQRTQFPTTTFLFGKNIELVAQNFISHSAGANMKDLQREAGWACEGRGARLPSENELKALAAMGDYNGGISLVANGPQNAFWALDHEEVYVANGGWTSPATNLNPSEFISYLCLR